LGIQVFGQKRTLKHAAVVLTGIGLLPGMPLIAFLTLAGLAMVLSRRKPPKAVPSAEAQAAAAWAQTGNPGLAHRSRYPRAGSRARPARHHRSRRGGELPGRVTALRKQIASELGLVIPAVHLRDNLRLDANEYRIKLRGLDLSTGIAYVDRVMALDPSGSVPRLDGVDALQAKEPAFGLPALWISPASVRGPSAPV
jgi:flagellar biosynthesis protein FlhA